VARRYAEWDPGEKLRSRVECFWTGDSGDAAESHRVFPDGCIDILYRRQEGRSWLDIVGAMTTFEDVTMPAGAKILGVRFRPGGVHGLARQASDDWTGRSIDLSAVTPREARWIKQQLDDDASPSRIAAILESALDSNADAAQRAIAHLEKEHGMVDLQWVADQANMSERQFRRVCLARTGLSPKQLCRALRFRHALAKLREGQRGDLTNIALDCGYYDHAHFAHEFREWSGLAPSEFIRR
jgi:AraC-like DNA-binding protein